LAQSSRAFAISFRSTISPAAITGTVSTSHFHLRNSTTAGTATSSRLSFALSSVRFFTVEAQRCPAARVGSSRTIASGITLFLSHFLITN
jgi:hypothetical protein